MKVTNVTVKLAPQSGDRLKAFCTITLDDEFVVRDLKIIEGTSGLFVAMPSRKLTDHCPKCGGKNHLRAKFCNDCGARLPDSRAPEEEAQGKLHADVAHPINSECRNRMQGVIVDAYRDELRNAGRESEADAPAEEFRDEPSPPAPEPPKPQPRAEPQAEPQAEPAPAPEPQAETPEAPPVEAGSEAAVEETGGEPAPESDDNEEDPAKGHIFGEGIL